MQDYINCTTPIQWSNEKKVKKFELAVKLHHNPYKTTHFIIRIWSIQFDDILKVQKSRMIKLNYPRSS